MAGWTGSAPAETEEATSIGAHLALPVELEPIVRAFLVGATQWRWETHWTFHATKAGPLSIPHTVPLGLDYAGLRHGLALAKLRLTPEEFDGLQIMEACALKLMARR